MNYREFLPSSMIIDPSHRDLVISAPFIVGIINSNL